MRKLLYEKNSRNIRNQKENNLKAGGCRHRHRSAVDSSASQRLFWTCLYTTMAIPILIWVYTWMYGKLTRKHTFADFDLFPGDADRAAEGNVNSGSAEESASGPDSAAESDVNSNSAAESASGSGPTQNHP